MICNLEFYWPLSNGVFIWALFIGLSKPSCLLFSIPNQNQATNQVDFQAHLLSPSLLLRFGPWLLSPSWFRSGRTERVSEREERKNDGFSFLQLCNPHIRSPCGLLLCHSLVSFASFSFSSVFLHALLEYISIIFPFCSHDCPFVTFPRLNSMFIYFGLLSCKGNPNLLETRCVYMRISQCMKGNFLAIYFEIY